MEKKTGDKAGTGGAITIVDSSWKISFGLTGLQKPMIPMNEPIYDLRVIASSAPTLLAFRNALPVPIA